MRAPLARVTRALLLAGTMVPAGAVGAQALKPVAALPAHVAGTFQEITACHQTADGQYFIFDRRAHSVFAYGPGMEAAVKLIAIGAETGRVLDPTAFDLAGDGTFAIADTAGGAPRIQMFVASGSSLGGFLMAGRAVPRITLGTLVLNGISGLEYTGKAIYVSQPETGGLVTEYALDGQPRRTFGRLRATGHEADAAVHLALNAGRVLVHPDGGFYFVFLAGVPQFRRYGADGRLLYERHIQGAELDPFIQELPSTWKRRRTHEGELPLVLPSVYAAAAAPDGALWVSLPGGVTYVYDSAGEKRRVVQFRGAGPVTPTGLSFGAQGRILVTPGCYAYRT